MQQVTVAAVGAMSHRVRRVASQAAGSYKQSGNQAERTSSIKFDIKSSIAEM